MKKNLLKGVGAEHQETLSVPLLRGSSTTGRRSYCQREVDAGCDEVGLGFDIASRCQDGASQLGRREGDRVEEELGDVVRAQMQQLVVRIGLRHLEGLVGASLAVEV